MATKTSLIIEATPQNSTSKKQKTIQNINPNATDENLHSMATKFNSLSTNTFNTAYRVDKKELEAS